MLINKAGNWGGRAGLAGEEGGNKFILVHAKYEMFIRHEGRGLLFVAGNLGLELGEVCQN